MLFRTLYYLFLLLYTLISERINTGVTDLIQMPSKAYSSGAGVQGITAAGLRGVTSLLANISAG